MKWSVEKRVNSMKSPSVNLGWLHSLTDDTGILQHAEFSVADRGEGHTTGDNAHALVAVLKYHRLRERMQALELARIYLSFLLIS